jgi:lactoylglutathione lyase
MSFREPFPILYARDVEQSVVFYCDALGFEVAFRWPADGALEYAYLRLGETGIGIANGSVVQGIGVPESHAPRRFELCVYTDDADAAAERLRSFGARELMAPTDQPWGERLCYFEDPNGNPIHITMRVAD